MLKALYITEYITKVHAKSEMRNSQKRDTQKLAENQKSIFR